MPSYLGRFVSDLKEYPTYDLSVFFFGDEVHQVIRTKGWYESALYLNSKNNFYEFSKRTWLQAPKPYASLINRIFPKLTNSFPVFF